ncbi:MAG: glycosyltransferase family 2 protein [Bacteroidota bacterium]
MTVLVSVVMPVFNSEKYLHEAIDSILNQSFENFEFLIINDGSTDSSESIIKSFSDKRIKYYAFEENVGYLKCLNFGIQNALGKYIARMDSDDISLPNRFSYQVDYMENNQEIGVCGTFIQYFGDESGFWRPPIKSEAIKAGLINGSTISHPASMIRASVLFENKIEYSKEYYLAEDYYLWYQLSSLTEFYNIPEVLLRYRINDKQVSTVFESKQTYLKQEIRFLVLQKIPNLNPMNTKSLINGEIELSSALSFIKFILNKNSKNRVFKKRYLQMELAMVLLNLAIKSGKPKDILRLILSSNFKFYTFQMKMGLLKRVLPLIR